MFNSNYQSKSFHGLEEIGKELAIRGRTVTGSLKSEWQRIEKDWRNLRRQTRPARQAAMKSLMEINAASEGLLQSVKRSYQRIKRSL